MENCSSSWSICIFNTAEKYYTLSYSTWCVHKCLVEILIIFFKFITTKHTHSHLLPLPAGVWSYSIKYSPITCGTSGYFEVVCFKIKDCRWNSHLKCSQFAAFTEKQYFKYSYSSALLLWNSKVTKLHALSGNWPKIFKGIFTLSYYLCGGSLSVLIAWARQLFYYHSHLV